jgi:hypothetical protein
MKAKEELSTGEYEAIKKSFFNIYILFLSEGPITKHLVDAILKWGIQLSINEEELNQVIKARETYQFTVPPREQALERIYDLVYMIYLDEVVEDAELEIAMLYAKKLGFEPHLVGDLLKAIVAAPADGISHPELKKEIRNLLLSS